MAISCEPGALVAASENFRCIRDENQMNVMIYLLRELAGLSNLTPAELEQLSSGFRGLPDATKQNISLYLLCQVYNRT